ncbi:hypothetical protein [Dactylosporangium matsuzakiense]|uniref:Uncharacterized protein n=1 Tax=Dactylosporangium matsuzakiense TaxID=53360 RepID=A0A9W6NNN8_9ACTN|nr:hypothetical protein [Dactylosporangium matsuzakiense]UWZ48171.1 hypothetical protein Dmats_18260 [Dactylosporangium matsuzakiense]GLL03192.1 hypothetical protein GCM10017581_049350 [Dactylosporangium matsuzakiense]
MTQADDGRDIGRMLDAAVPELAAPPDRLAAVGRRVRRRQRRAGLAAACVVLVLVGGAVAFATGHAQPERPERFVPAGPPAGDCPARPPVLPYGDGALPDSAPGDLAPAGAVRAVYCRYDPVPELNMTRPAPPRRLVLTRDVAGLVTVLNALPRPYTSDACFNSGGGGGYLTLEYATGPAATIELSSACWYVRRGDITRYDGVDAWEAFDARFAAQELAASRPAAVRAVSCADRLTTGPADNLYSPDPAYDVWLHTPQIGWHMLPVPLAVVTACRFVHGPGGWERSRQVVNRAVAKEATTAVEAAAKQLAGDREYAGCPTPPRTIDVLMLRDAVGETREVRLTRDTCPRITFDFKPAPAASALNSIVDKLLGRPD